MKADERLNVPRYAGTSTSSSVLPRNDDQGYYELFRQDWAGMPTKQTLQMGVAPMRELFAALRD